jgi:metal-sulfur cluster biosynthetic enzyme
MADENMADEDMTDDMTEDMEASLESGEGGSLPELVREALKLVIDPELGLNIVDLGLIYDVEVEDGLATVTMTLTSPGCPAGGMIMASAQEAARGTDGVDEADVRLVWKPFWSPDLIDPDIRAALGF